MRRRFIQINGELREVVDGYLEPSTAMIQPDIAPYQSMVTGEMIQGRAQHREHLKKHGMKEVGNEVKYVTQQPIPDAAPEKRKELLVAQFQAMNEHQFRAMWNRDITNAKWNSRRH